MNYQNNFSRGSGQRGGFNRGGGSQSHSSRGDGFRARCAECGNDCTVPFKPNGRKPVLCSNCFQGGRQDNTRRFGGDSDQRPFKRSFDKPRSNSQSGGPGIEIELKQIKRKLDQILDILQEVTIEEHDE